VDKVVPPVEPINVVPGRAREAILCVNKVVPPVEPVEQEEHQGEERPAADIYGNSSCHLPPLIEIIIHPYDQCFSAREIKLIFIYEIRKEGLPTGLSK